MNGHLFLHIKCFQPYIFAPTAEIKELKSRRWSGEKPVHIERRFKSRNTECNFKFLNLGSIRWIRSCRNKTYWMKIIVFFTPPSVHFFCRIFIAFLFSRKEKNWFYGKGKLRGQGMGVRVVFGEKSVREGGRTKETI